MGAWFVHLERRMLRRSDAVITISPDFEPILAEWGIPAERVHVIENWAPIEDLPTRTRRNPWSAHHGPDDKRRLLQAGV